MIEQGLRHLKAADSALISFRAYGLLSISIRDQCKVKSNFWVLQVKIQTKKKTKKTWVLLISCFMVSQIVFRRSRKWVHGKLKCKLAGRSWAWNAAYALQCPQAWNANGVIWCWEANMKGTHLHSCTISPALKLWLNFFLYMYEHLDPMHTSTDKFKVL